MKTVARLALLVAVLSAVALGLFASRRHATMAGQEPSVLPAAYGDKNKEAPLLSPDVFSAVLPPPLFEISAGENHLFATRGTLRAGASMSRPFNLPRLAKVSVVLAASPVRYEFRAPDGSTIVPGTTPDGAGYEFVVGDGHVTGFKLDHPATGLWTIIITAPATPTEADYVVDIASEGDAPAAAHLETMPREGGPRSTFVVKPGEPVFIRVFIADHGQPVEGVQWSIRALSPRDSLLLVTVFDDGHHADGPANDGVFVGAIVAEGPEGIYQIRASGRLPNGVDYVTTGTIEVQVPHDLYLADTIAVAPSRPQAGRPLTLTVTASNAGTVDTHDAELNFIVGARKVSSQRFDLPAGESRNLVTTWTPPSANNYDVQLTISPYSEPYTANFANNTRRAVIQVR